MALPRKTRNSSRYAQMATRGVLTRMALWFNARPDQKFTGDDIARILIEGVAAIGRPDEGKIELEMETLQPAPQQLLES